MSYPAPQNDGEEWKVACKVRVRRSFNVITPDHGGTSTVFQEDEDVDPRPGPTLEIGCTRVVPEVYEEVDSDDLRTIEDRNHEQGAASEEDEIFITEEY